MNQYDFLNLSYIEFEELAKDLLQQEMECILHSFAPGADKGIDIKGLNREGTLLIIQCKRYSLFKDLWKELLLERPKLDKLDLEMDYMLVTSVNLTVGQTEKIANLFSPYMTTDAKIIGRNQVNGMLRKFPSVESNHFKLWIASSTVLNRILKSKVVNQSRFEAERIQEMLKLYVVNPSFTDAQQMIKTNRVVIISGIPGIGKTTLARILSYFCMSKLNYQEFIYLSGSIDEGYELYKDGVRQVFLYDDFLGQSFEDRKLDRNEDKRLLEFIHQVQKSNDKILLFTTREYILNDAQLHHELLTHHAIELSKLVIDLKVYTRLIKAKILYNHLYFSEMPFAYYKSITSAPIYSKILNHRNYNPRLIETCVGLCRQSGLPDDSFVQLCISSLDNPTKLWEQPFTTQISNMGRILLLILATTGEPIMMSDMEDALRKYWQRHTISTTGLFTIQEYKRSLQELENSFIKITRDDYSNKAISFQNPSVRDFLLYYLENNPDILLEVLQAGIFFEQFFKIFTQDIQKTQPTPYYFARKILGSETVNQTRLTIVMEQFDQLKDAEILTFKTSSQNKLKHHRMSPSIYIKLLLLSDAFKETPLHKMAEKFVVSRLQENIYFQERIAGNAAVASYITLIEQYYLQLTFNPDQLIEKLFEHIWNLDQLESEFKRLYSLLPEAFTRFKASHNTFSSIITGFVEEKLKKVEPAELKSLLETVANIQTIYNIELANYIQDLEEKVETWENEQNEEADMDLYEAPEDDEKNSELESIRIIFESLIPPGTHVTPIEENFLDY